MGGYLRRTSHASPCGVWTFKFEGVVSVDDELPPKRTTTFCDTFWDHLTILDTSVSDQISHIRSHHSGWHSWGAIGRTSSLKATARQQIDSGQKAEASSQVRLQKNSVLLWLFHCCFTVVSYVDLELVLRFMVGLLFDCWLTVVSSCFTVVLQTALELHGVLNSSKKQAVPSWFSGSSWFRLGFRGLSPIFLLLFSQERDPVTSWFPGSFWIRLGIQGLSPYFSLAFVLRVPCFRRGILFHHDVLLFCFSPNSSGAEWGSQFFLETVLFPSWCPVPSGSGWGSRGVSPLFSFLISRKRRPMSFWFVWDLCWL